MPLLATRSNGSSRGFGFRGIFIAPPGQQVYTSAGTYSWVCPAGVTSVSVVVVGKGGKNWAASGPNGSVEMSGGGGGGLAYKNEIAVVAGQSYTVVINSTSGGQNYFINNSTVCATNGIDASGYTGGSGGYMVAGTGGGSGGKGGDSITYTPQPIYRVNGGGGGAAGYSGNGGAGGQGSVDTAGSDGSGGGGGGGGTSASGGPASGGGVGVLGQGASGTGGGAYTAGGAGSGGSGTTYGGGSGSGSAGAGAIRIIWPGNTRQFPSTNTGNL